MHDTKFRACHETSRSRRAYHRRQVRRFWKNALRVA